MMAKNAAAAIFSHDEVTRIILRATNKMAGRLSSGWANMAMAATSDEHYLQGGLDYQFVQPLDPSLECSICLLCLRNPHQTSCGHRFCHTCILTWLKEGKYCPHDQSSLGEGTIPPNFHTPIKASSYRRSFSRRNLGPGN